MSSSAVSGKFSFPNTAKSKVEPSAITIVRDASFLSLNVFDLLADLRL